MLKLLFPVARVIPLLLVTGLGTTGCTYVGPLEVNTYWSPGVEKSRIGPVYDWSPRLVEAIETAEPDMARTSRVIQTTLSEELNARGYRQASGDAADVLINFNIGTKTMGPGTAAVDFVKQGSLVVDLLDPAEGGRLWRGVAHAEIQREDSPDVRDKRVKEALRRMLADLPTHTK